MGVFRCGWSRIEITVAAVCAIAIAVAFTLSRPNAERAALPPLYVASTALVSHDQRLFIADEIGNTVHLIWVGGFDEGPIRTAAADIYEQFRAKRQAALADARTKTEVTIWLRLWLDSKGGPAYLTVSNSLDSPWQTAVVTFRPEVAASKSKLDD